MKSAICLIVRNEVRDIAEWIAFHALAGFDTQIIFDNLSDDGTAEVIRAAGRLHDIRYHRWPNVTQSSQLAAYDAACNAYKLEFDWIAFVDSDEFVMLMQGETVNSFLARFDEWSGVALHWAIYGTDGHDDFPEGLVLESFLRRAAPTFFPARHVKSIVRPRFVNRCVNPHCFDLRGHRLGSYADSQGRSMTWWPAPELGGVLPGLGMALPDYSVARINHYFTRSRAHWAAKMRRGYPSDVAVRKEAEFETHNRNEVEDRTACRHVPALRTMVAEIDAILRAG